MQKRDKKIENEKKKTGKRKKHDKRKTPAAFAKNEIFFKNQKM